MKESLKPGIEHELQFLVPIDKTVPALLPESPELRAMPEVLATGYLVGLIEWTCVRAVIPHLDWPREQTVGTRVNVTHSAATPPGLQVRVRVKLTEVDGRRLVFDVDAHDGVDQISQGTHERYVINAEKFNAKAREKATGVPHRGPRPETARRPSTGFEPKPTRIFQLAGGSTDQEALDYASVILRRGGLVVFPTETVYGLGANALSEEAVNGIFRAKGRPSDNPLIVHLDSARALPTVAKRIPPVARRLASNFWPGPLTIVLPKNARVPAATTAGLDTVAVRVPRHPVAQRLIAMAGVPVAAPSANLSGRPSLTSPQYLVEELSGKVDVILLSGESPIGVESTVVDATSRPPRVLRPGGLPVERIRKVISSLETPASPPCGPIGEGMTPRSPGMKYRHYAPRARVTLYVGAYREVWRELRYRRRVLTRQGIRVTLLVSEESSMTGKGIWRLGSRRAPSTVARRLFSALRDADASGAEEILVEGFPVRGLGWAVMDRLRRAAEGHVVTVGERGDTSRATAHRVRTLPMPLTRHG